MIHGIRSRFHYLFPDEPYWIPLVLFLVNMVAKGLFISSNSLAHDEPFSVYHAQMDIPSIISLLAQGNNPPLYEIILHFWIKCFGISEGIVRFPSLLFSSITVILIYRIGIRFFSIRVAIYASILFIFSTYQVAYAHEARVYAWLGLLSVASMYVYMGLIRQYTSHSHPLSWPIARLTALIIIDLLMIYSHYFGFFILIFQFVFILIHPSLFAKMWQALIIISLAIAIGYLPNATIVYERFLEAKSSGTWVKPPNGIHSLYNLFAYFSNAPLVAVFALLILLISLIVFLRKNHESPAKVYSRLIVSWFFSIYLAMFFISYHIPMFVDRYLMPAAIAYGLLLGLATDYLSTFIRPRILIPACFLISFVATADLNVSNKRNVSEVVRKIVQLRDNHTVVYICPSWFEMNFVYYFDRACFRRVCTTDIKTNMYSTLHLNSIYPIDHHSQILPDTLHRYRRAIFLDDAADFASPHNGILSRLHRLYRLVGHYHYYQTFQIYVFER